MQVWDVRRALAALRSLPDLRARRVDLLGRGQAAAMALWAAVFEPEVGHLVLEALPATVREGPGGGMPKRSLAPWTTSVGTATASSSGRRLGEGVVADARRASERSAGRG